MQDKDCAAHNPACTDSKPDSTVRSRSLEKQWKPLIHFVFGLFATGHAAGQPRFGAKRSNLCRSDCAPSPSFATRCTRWLHWR
jgi:hypothetical protein